MTTDEYARYRDPELDSPVNYRTSENVSCETCRYGLSVERRRSPESPFAGCVRPGGPFWCYYDGGAHCTVCDLFERTNRQQSIPGKVFDLGESARKEYWGIYGKLYAGLESDRDESDVRDEYAEEKGAFYAKYFPDNRGEDE